VAPNLVYYWSVTLLRTFAHTYVVIVSKYVPNSEVAALANFEVFVSPEVAGWVLLFTHLKYWFTVPPGARSETLHPISFF
jgi:hypothetical protein